MILFSDEVIDDLFSNVRGVIKGNVKGKKYHHLVALRVNNDDEELRKFLEEGKNKKTKKQKKPGNTQMKHYPTENVVLLV